MVNAAPLAQLHDIHLPNVIGIWPLAPGWWLLFVIFIGLVFFVSYRFFKYYAKNKAKRQALVLLNQYWLDYKNVPDVALGAARVGILLKRVALAYYPRQNVASLQGQAWLLFLNHSSKGLDFVVLEPLLLQAAYQAEPTGDLSLLFDMARKWIVQRSYHV